MSTPAWNTEARFVEAGQRIWRFGRWHKVTRKQYTGTSIVLTTDEQTGENQFGPTFRTFIAVPNCPVAATG